MITTACSAHAQCLPAEAEEAVAAAGGTERRGSDWRLPSPPARNLASGTSPGAGSQLAQGVQQEQGPAGLGRGLLQAKKHKKKGRPAIHGKSIRPRGEDDEDVHIRRLYHFSVEIWAAPADSVFRHTKVCAPDAGYSGCCGV